MLVLVFTLFLLISADRMKRIVVEVAGPTLSRKKVTVQIIDEIARQVQHFLLVQLLTSAIVAMLTTLVLWRLGLQNAAVWGLAAGVLNTLPYFGPLLATHGTRQRRARAVRHVVDGGLGRRLGAGDHVDRRLFPHALAAGPLGADEPGRGVRRHPLLELDLGPGRACCSRSR